MQMNISVDFELHQCSTCGIHHYVPTRYMDECRRDPKQFFHCPAGHARHFAESEAEKLRKERDRLAQRIAERDDEIKRQRDLRHGVERQLVATRGVVTRIKNRVGHGVCPCCNRSFGDLARHMMTKHPSYTAEAAE